MTWVDRFRLHERVATDHHIALVRALGLESSDRILDAGCGTGGIAAHLARAVRNGGEVLGIDKEAEFITAAQTNAWPNLRFEVANIHAIPSADATFDLVWCCNVIRYLSDPSLALAEMVRVLKPGGRLVLAEAAHPTRFFVVGGSEEFRGFDARLEAAQTDRTFWPPRGWSAMLRSAGVSEVRLRTHLFEFGHPFDPDQVAWIQDRLERLAGDATLRSALEISDKKLLTAVADPDTPLHFSRLDFTHVRMATTLYPGLKRS
jgi:SAM-dependent methyltransferase